MNEMLSGNLMIGRTDFSMLNAKSIRDRTTMRKEIDVNGVNIFTIPGRARQAFSFLKTQSCQLHAVKNGKSSKSWNVRRCRLRKQHRLLLKRKRTVMKWDVRAKNV
jgi:hypothetical protein